MTHPDQLPLIPSLLVAAVLWGVYVIQTRRAKR